MRWRCGNYMLMGGFWICRGETPPVGFVSQASRRVGSGQVKSQQQKKKRPATAQCYVVKSQYQALHMYLGSDRTETRGLV